MGKKKINVLSYLYLIGLAVVAIGFCCPMFKGIFGTSANGFKFINFNNSVFVSIGALMIFLGAVCGIVVKFLPKLTKNKLDFLCLLISIAGGVVLLIGFTTNGGIYKAIRKAFLKNATAGFYMIVVGWVIAITGYFSK